MSRDMNWTFSSKRKTPSTSFLIVFPQCHHSGVAFLFHPAIRHKFMGLSSRGSVSLWFGLTLLIMYITVGLDRSIAALKYARDMDF